MNGQELDTEVTGWFSTYGLITAKRLLEHYKIKIADKDLFKALKKDNSFYQRLLKVPMSNIFNGIILQQSRDYQVYVQKILIDYLLSGESDKREDIPGGSTREEIEEERQYLVSSDAEFRELELFHESLIARSQTALIASSQAWHDFLDNNEQDLRTDLAAYALIKPVNTLRSALATLLTVFDYQVSIDKDHAIWSQIAKIMEVELTPELKDVFISQLTKLSSLLREHEQQWAVFFDESSSVQARAKQFRKLYHDAIIKVNDLIMSLPEYKSNDDKIEENKEFLYFDPFLGEESSS